MFVYDARRSVKKKSRTPPIAQFVNAAYDIKPWKKKKLCM